MDTTTTTEPAGKRARNGSVVLTDRMCEKRVAKRVKIYDRKCPGLYVSITTAGAATFSFKFTDPADRQAAHRLAWRLQPRDLRRRGRPQQGLRPEGHGRCGARRNLPRPESAAGEARQDRR